MSNSVIRPPYLGYTLRWYGTDIGKYLATDFCLARRTEDTWNDNQNSKKLASKVKVK